MSKTLLTPPSHLPRAPLLYKSSCSPPPPRIQVVLVEYGSFFLWVILQFSPLYVRGPVLGVRVVPSQQDLELCRVSRLPSLAPAVLQCGLHSRHCEY